MNSTRTCFQTEKGHLLVVQFFKHTHVHVSSNLEQWDNIELSEYRPFTIFQMYTTNYYGGVEKMLFFSPASRETFRT